MNEKLNTIRDAIRAHGLHKLAERVMTYEGHPVPASWEMPDVGMALGVKIAMRRQEHQSIAQGLGSLYSITGDLGEKTSSESLYTEFYRVKNLSGVSEKLASEGARAEAARYEVGLWQRMKKVASYDELGVELGLAKIAVRIFSDSIAAGEKLASSAESMIQFAASFACASVVDDAIVNMVKTGELSPKEGLKMAELNARSAINDLKTLTRDAEEKTASPRWMKGPGVTTDEVQQMLRTAGGASQQAAKNPERFAAVTGDLASKFNGAVKTLGNAWTGYSTHEPSALVVQRVRQRLRQPPDNFFDPLTRVQPRTVHDKARQLRALEPGSNLIDAYGRNSQLGRGLPDPSTR